MENNSFNVLANNNMSSFPLFNSKIEPSIAPALIAVAPIAKYLATALAKWALKQGFAKLKSEIFPGNETATMEKVRLEVQTILNQTLQTDRVATLKAEYEGFIHLGKVFTDYVSQSTFTPATAKTHFLNMSNLLIQRLPQFEIAGYEGVSISLFTQMCTLHLGLLKDGILAGSDWGFTPEDKDSLICQFNRYVNEYNTRMMGLYSIEFGRLLAKNLNEALNFRNMCSLYVFPFSEAWYLLRYEGTKLENTLSLWNFVGEDIGGILHNDWKGALYKLLMGATNQRLANVRFNYSYFSDTQGTIHRENILGAHPTYNGEQTPTGWIGNGRLGRFSAPYSNELEITKVEQEITYNNKGDHSNSIVPANTRNEILTATVPITADPFFKTADINWRYFSQGLYYGWNIKFDDRVILNSRVPGGIPSNRLEYDGYYIRAVSACPRNVPLSYNHNYLTLTYNRLEYDAPTTQNIIVGFSPNNTKSFYARNSHYLSATNDAYVIPALQFATVSDRSFLEDTPDQATDGSIKFTETVLGNEAKYSIRLNTGFNTATRYRLVIRFKATARLAAGIRVRSQNSGNNRLLGGIPVEGNSGWVDYITDSFTFNDLGITTASTNAFFSIDSDGVNASQQWYLSKLILVKDFVNNSGFRNQVPLAPYVIARCPNTFFVSNNTSSGYEQGYNDNYNQNTSSGYEQGYNDNYNQNTSSGYEQGYNDNYNQNTSSGYEQGYNDNYNQNTSSGYEQGYNDNYNQNTSSGV
uniref:Pesticidal crystal protein Cry11Bb n=1 Tax=Bacillus thuringiensis subsp. medellin TaxID=79672 RepID=C11BB_BACTV|nr:RecName: Full=Pesticidal crystal protein Cry11Bb; AltName: Full=84 kDa crystal protein; AltName: Full=Crystaline entomocidal protoxin; AltName: Full=Insecticidal delta-endotoxin CryXIB(b) [Bacillus thuringiensis serovar medellin]AAC97162.1 d-endotoxin [Bacillus thuringiensis serovar medellin]